MKAVIVCGSREWSDASLLGDVVLSLPKGTILIHGAAYGADIMAGTFGRSAGLIVIPMPAQWNTHGKYAGPARNHSMLVVLKALRDVGYDCEVHAFPLGESRGTRQMMRIAGEAGFIVTAHSAG